MWRKNLRVHPHFPPGDRGGVRRDDLQKDFYALLHLRDADQFLEAQGVVGAIVEVGSGDSLLGEGNPVRAAAPPKAVDGREGGARTGIDPQG